MTRAAQLQNGGNHPLMAQHPWYHILVVTMALLASTALLFMGLSLPLMDAQTGILWKHWKNSYSVWAGVVSLWDQRQYLLALVIFFFSMIFPFLKLLVLAVIWFVRLGKNQRAILLHWLEILGKWSMLDVFAVAILVVLVKLGPLANIQPRKGVYFFAAAILASMLTTMYITRLARKSS